MGAHGFQARWPPRRPGADGGVRDAGRAVQGRDPLQRRGHHAPVHPPPYRPLPRAQGAGVFLFGTALATNLRWRTYNLRSKSAESKGMVLQYEYFFVLSFGEFKSAKSSTQDKKYTQLPPHSLTQPHTFRATTYGRETSMHCRCLVIRCLFMFFWSSLVAKIAIQEVDKHCVEYVFFFPATGGLRIRKSTGGGKGFLRCNQSTPPGSLATSLLPTGSIRTRT